jgi:hypothetical protein
VGKHIPKPGNPTLLLIGTVELAVWGRASQVPMFTESSYGIYWAQF